MAEVFRELKTPFGTSNKIFPDCPYENMFYRKKHMLSSISTKISIVGK